MRHILFLDDTGLIIDEDLVKKIPAINNFYLDKDNNAKSFRFNYNQHEFNYAIEKLKVLNNNVELSDEDAQKFGMLFNDLGIKYNIEPIETYEEIINRDINKERARYLFNKLHRENCYKKYTKTISMEGSICSKTSDLSFKSQSEFDAYKNEYERENRRKKNFVAIDENDFVRTQTRSTYVTKYYFGKMITDDKLIIEFVVNDELVEELVRLLIQQNHTKYNVGCTVDYKNFIIAIATIENN